jgi:hypothetical protein
MLAPWYWLALALPDATAVDHAHYAHYQADLFVRSFLVHAGYANAYTVLAAILSYKTALSAHCDLRGRRGRRPSLCSGATPLIYYSTVEPYMAHAVRYVLIALALFLYLRPRVPWLGWAWCFRWPFLCAGSSLCWRCRSSPQVYRRRWADGGRVSASACSRWPGLSLSWFSSCSIASLWCRRPSRTMRPFLGVPVHALDVLFNVQRGLFVWSPLTSRWPLSAWRPCWEVNQPAGVCGAHHVCPAGGDQRRVSGLARRVGATVCAASPNCTRSSSWGLLTSCPSGGLLRWPVWGLRAPLFCRRRRHLLCPSDLHQRRRRRRSVQRPKRSLRGSKSPSRLPV